MIYQILNIQRDVRGCLDENRVDTSLLSVGDADTLRFDEVVESKIVEAVDRVHQQAPYWLLHQGHNLSGSGINWYGDTDTAGWLLLPSDFLRLVVFEMSDWERPVYATISTLDPEYAKQKSRIKGIRGTAERPVVAIGVLPTGKVLEFYACKNRSATLTKGVYVPYAAVDVNGGVDISERCYPAVVYTVAALALVSCGEAERAKLFFELAKTYLEK